MQEPPSASHIGVLLAAGRGVRMGRTKQLVPWPTVDGELPLVAAAYDAIRGICHDMVVVLGHEADAVAAALGARPFHSIESDPDTDMFESIRSGIFAALMIDSAAILILQPADHPEVAAATLKTLLDVSRDQPGIAIMPTYRGRGGHPVLIPADVGAQVLLARSNGGLRQFWVDRPELCLRVPVDDSASTRDVDTPDQLPGR